MTKFTYKGEAYTATPIAVFVEGQDNSPEAAKERARRLNQATRRSDLMGGIIRAFIYLFLAVIGIPFIGPPMAIMWLLDKLGWTDSLSVVETCSLSLILCIIYWVAALVVLNAWAMGG